MGSGGRIYLIATMAVLLAVSSVPSCRGHNITKILADHPEFSTFNHYLTATHLASEINHRLTITVLAIDNSAMSALLSKHFTIYTIKNVLSLHILADYFGAKKLHQINHHSTIVSSLFQATGSAEGISGYVNITHFRGGKVGFGAKDTALDASFVKSVKEIPYNISVIQISALLNSPEAEAPAPPPNSYNLTELMTKKGCGAFAALVAANADVQKTIETYVDGGLTLFCPVDDAVSKFMPLWKKLTPEGKTALLLYHAVSDYYSMQMLKQNPGILSTLATDGKNFNFSVVNGKAESVSLDTKLASSAVTGTVIDEQPLAIYILNKVLEPRELFKPVAAPAAGGKGKGTSADGSDSADAPAGDSVDVRAADGSTGSRAATAVGVLLSVAVSLAAFLVAGL